VAFPSDWTSESSAVGTPTGREPQLRPFIPQIRFDMSIGEFNILSHSGNSGHGSTK